MLLSSGAERDACTDGGSGCASRVRAALAKQPHRLGRGRCVLKRRACVTTQRTQESGHAKNGCATRHAGACADAAWHGRSPLTREKARA
jgi:hypothetical protein